MGLIPLKQVKKHDENQPHFFLLICNSPTTSLIPLYLFRSIFILKFDQPQSFEKKP